MKTNVEAEGPTQRKITVSADPNELTPIYEETIKRLGREVKIPGFRKGKVPRAILETRLGTDSIREEFLRDAIPQLYAKAAVEHDLEPITQPEIEVTSYEQGASLEFSATIEVRPEIELPADLSLQVSRPASEPTNEEIDGQLDRLRERFATLEPVGRNAAPGDHVTIDMFGYRHDEKIEAASAEDLLYEVGSGGFLAELDQQLEGKRTGDILQFNATLPERFGPPHGGQELSFRVVVKEVQTKKLPDLDDEFAKTSSEFDTLEDLRAEVAKRIAAVKEVEADLVVRNRLVDQLLELVPVTPPKTMVAVETEARLARLLRELERAGLTLEEYLESNEASQEQLVDSYRQVAEKMVSADLILEKVAQVEDVKVEREDLDSELENLSRQTGREPKEILQELVENGRVNSLAGDILRRKALDLVVERASITEEADQTA